MLITDSAKLLIFLIGLVFLTSLIMSNDLTLPYFASVILFIISSVFLITEKLKSAFVLSSILTLIYNYQIGIFFQYFIQDFIPDIVSYRIMGYGAMGTLPFIFLSLISIWFIYKSYKTTKKIWYIAFVCLIILSSLRGYEGYGSNYLFKIVLITLNAISFNQIKTVVNKT